MNSFWGEIIPETEWLPQFCERIAIVRALKAAMIDLSAQQQIEGYEKAKAIPPSDIREKA